MPVNNIAYCVSKGGIRMLTRAAGVELGAHNIRVINIAPGAVATPINASTEADPANMKTLDTATPLGGWRSPARSPSWRCSWRRVRPAT